MCIQIFEMCGPVRTWLWNFSLFCEGTDQVLVLAYLLRTHRIPECRGQIPSIRGDRRRRLLSISDTEKVVLVVRRSSNGATFRQLGGNAGALLVLDVQEALIAEFGVIVESLRLLIIFQNQSRILLVRILHYTFREESRLAQILNYGLSIVAFDVHLASLGREFSFVIGCVNYVSAFLTSSSCRIFQHLEIFSRVS